MQLDSQRRTIMRHWVKLKMTLSQRPKAFKKVQLLEGPRANLLSHRQQHQRVISRSVVQSRQKWARSTIQVQISATLCKRPKKTSSKPRLIEKNKRASSSQQWTLRTMSPSQTTFLISNCAFTGKSCLPKMPSSSQ